MLLARHSALVKLFELSSRAAALVGPNALKPAALRSSTMPAAIGASGPTTTKSTALVLAERDHRGMVGDIERRRIRPPGRCRHCRARTRAVSPAGTPRSSRPAHVRDRRSRAGECSWKSRFRIVVTVSVARLPSRCKGGHRPSFRTARPARRSGISSLACTVTTRLEIPGSMLASLRPAPMRSR